MATLQNSIAQAIRNWPTVFGCRTDVLYQYFCVLGNGLEWVDGALFDRFGESTPSERASMMIDETERVERLYETLANRPDIDAADGRRIIALAQIRARRCNQEVQFRIDNADLLALIPWRYTPVSSDLDFCGNPCVAQAIAPLSPTESMLFTIPDDVQADWLAGAREMIFAVFQAPSAKPHRRLTPEQSLERRNSTIALADKALLHLHQRFSSPPGLPTSLAEWQQSAWTSRDPSNLLRQIDDAT